MIPPFIGFFGKQSVIYSAIDSGFYFMTFIAILVSVISAVYYLKLIKEAYSSPMAKDLSGNLNVNEETENLGNYILSKGTESNIKSTNTSSHFSTGTKLSVMSPFITFLDYILKIEKNYVDFKVLNLSSIHAFIISLLTFTIILFFVNPSILMNSASLITLNYFYL
jgi:NADH:ubiquinone oxidoreductase subunit 5 (subunit L)/multisubunit Na+/H+ antiporter MnhA subunit